MPFSSPDRRSSAARRTVPVEPVYKFSEAHVECAGDADEDIQAGTSTAAFDAADVGPMEFGPLGQTLLRQLPLETQPSHPLAEGSSDVHET